MGRRGPAPKPTALKLAAGNPGHRPINKREPIPPPGEPEIPEHLGPAGRKVWDQLVPRLVKVGLARSIDGFALGRYCELYARWWEAAQFIGKYKTRYPVRAEPKVDSKGNFKEGRILCWREFPEAAEMRKLHRDLLAIEREFGLTPAARTRIQLDVEAKSANDPNEIKRRFFLEGVTTPPPPPALSAGPAAKRPPAPIPLSRSGQPGPPAPATSPPRGQSTAG